MTNYEEYKDDILTVTNVYGCDFGIDKNDVITPCSKMMCYDCQFSSEDKVCNLLKIKWLYDEYKIPSVDWENVPIDTPVLVKNEMEDEWEKRHFSGVYYNQLRTFADGKTSWSKYGYETWKYMKLGTCIKNIENKEHED